jgi:hypothetical protein
MPGLASTTQAPTSSKSSMPRRLLMCWRRE